MPPGRLSSTSSVSDGSDKLNLDDDEEWKDAESDEEKVHFVSLFGEETFDSIHSMLKHCKTVHKFDLVKIRDDLDLDFLWTVKLVNFVRGEVQRGNKTLNISSKAVFEDDKYLQPVLEDDALLYSLDDILGNFADDKEPLKNGNGYGYQHGYQHGYQPEAHTPDPFDRVIQLEKELQRLQHQFTEYRETVSLTLENRWNSTDDASGSVNGIAKSNGTAPLSQDDDTHYFSSYSTNDIHEIMLKDSVRTYAYRDFIYDNKHLFKDKVVLDVGCGTGILSMFCAQAGAAKVIAVDNSEIINKARENVHENGLGETIMCLHGKIEDVSLPVHQVDIIVSEWMGYCLLYEAMLDSVLWARDRYLTRHGLMIPSHITLRIAPLADPEYIKDHIAYWQSVYGFKMTSMLANIYDEVVVRDVKSSAFPAESDIFVELPLHFIRKEELTFSSKPFSLELKADIASLDGFAIWFDTFLLPSKEHKAPIKEGAEKWEFSRPTKHGLAFTTGPGGPKTHWQQGVLLIDHGKRGPEGLKKGQIIYGEIGYKKRDDNQRELDISIKWEVMNSGEKGEQLWFMR